MKNILRQSESKTEINALFIQPSTLCSFNCKGCYVKENVIGKKLIAMDPDLIKDLVLQAGLDKVFWANQITYALDEGAGLRKQLEYYLKAISSLKELQKDLPQFHLTVHSIATLFRYMQYGVDFKNLDMISLSTPPYLKETFKMLKKMYPKTEWNLNIFNPVKDLEILKEFDSIYLLLHKKSIGPDSIGYKDPNSNRIKNLLSWKDTLPSELAKKIVLDGCIEDGKNFNKVGSTCSAGISRFQVWPDGRVTGCAYAGTFLPNQEKTAHTFNTILSNIRKAKRGEKEFKRFCYIPELVKEIG